MLVEKNLDYEFKLIDLKNKLVEFLKIFFIGRVFVFVEEDDIVIWDFILIVEYLDEIYLELNFYFIYF